MSIVDDLLANPGLYIGVDHAVGAERGGDVGSARMVVTPLPGGIGVALDYEVLNPTTGDAVRGHVEHTLVARTTGGATVMIVADTHAGGLATLVETEPGVFEPGPDGTPYPMKVVVSVPEPGTIHHDWWYDRPGGEATPRDRAVLERQG